ncbi:hypothetical protein BJV82DRAFT_631853 [Fennellomyces sp. T-0311]|nr:hypothetical protein BJV82DRAFT_631853 [Fennellomyces sp. T-0311]
MPYADTLFDGDMPNGSKLTHLSWSGGPSITPREIETVLAACPQLIYLKLGGCQDPLPLLSIRRQCPSTMRYLGLNTGKCDEFDAYWDEPPAVTPGLRALAVACVPENWIDLCQIVWADPIKDLTVFHDDTSFDATSLLRLYHGQYLRLQHTRQMYQYRSTIRARVSVGNRTQEVTSTFCRNYMDQCPWFITSLRSAIDPQQTLLELEFTQCFIDSSLLPLLEHLLPCVRELHTINCVMESAALAGLVSGLSEMERPQPMHHIRFSSIPGLTDSLVHQLAAIDGLQHVTLSYCDAVTDEGVRYLVDHSVHLEELDIRGCKWVSGETESYIQQKLEYRHHHHLPLF